MIDKIGTLFHRYRRAEPCKMHYFVDLLPQITAYDYPDNDDAQEYRRICEESGWQFVAANKQFHVFCADGAGEPPVPIQTDNAVHAQIYLKACRKQELWPNLFILIVIFGFFCIACLGNGIHMLLSNLTLFSAIGMSFLGICELWTVGFSLQWYMKARRAAKDDLPLPVVSTRLVRLRGTVFLLGAGVAIASFLTGYLLEKSGGAPTIRMFNIASPYLGVLVGLFIRHQVDTKPRTRTENHRMAIGAIVAMLILMGIFQALMFGKIDYSAYDRESLGTRPALHLADVGVGTDDISTGTLIKGSILVPDDYWYWESSRGGNVETRVYRAISDGIATRLYDHFAEQLHERVERQGEIVESLHGEQAALWGATHGLIVRNDESRVILLLQDGTTVLELEANSDDLSGFDGAVRALW